MFCGFESFQRYHLRECNQIAGLALMAERLVEAEGVGGSSPSASTTLDSHVIGHGLDVNKVL